MSEILSEEITTKNTKSEILDAYKELLKQVKEYKRENRKNEMEMIKQREVVQTAKQYSPDIIIQDLAKSRLQMTKFFETICEQIIEEYKKLTGLQQAIEVEKKSLHDQYEINTSADTLAALLLGQKKKKEEFEQEMALEREIFEEEMSEKKKAWNKEKALFEANQKEEQQKLIRERQREEEEYRYRLELERKKEQDQYLLKKTSVERELEEKKKNVEKELADRLSVLTSREQEFNKLKEEVATFPEIMKKAVSEAEQKAVERLKMEYKFSTDLKEKEIEGERRLNKQIIDHYLAKIREMESQIVQLTQKSDQANLQVQDIAVKAIEGAAGIQKRFQRQFEYQKTEERGQKS